MFPAFDLQHIPRTDLWELFDPHPRLKLHVLHVQALGVGGGVVGEVHLHRHHVGVGDEGLPAEAVLHRQALPRDAVQQLVALERAGQGDGLQENRPGESDVCFFILESWNVRLKRVRPA